MSTCIYCHTEVVWPAVINTQEGRFACDLADHYGMEALTERRQLIVLQRICAQCIDDEISALRAGANDGIAFSQEVAL